MEAIDTPDLRVGVGKQLIFLLTDLGFNYQVNPSVKKKYYTHKKSGNQIRLNFKHRKLTFLDRAGFKLGSSSFTSQGELERFIKHKRE